MIIIKTPQPDTEERLVLVPLDACNEVREDDPRTKLGAKVGLTIFGCHARDATPADLARAGYVPREQADPGTLAHLRADLRDAVRERDELRHHYDAAAPEHNLVALLDSYESDADTARAQASAAYAMVVAAIGSVGAETIEAAVARLVADRGALVARAAQAERELSEAKAGHTAVQPRIYALEAELARREAIIAETWDAIGGRQGLLLLPEAAATIRHERDEARAELARLTAAVEGEPSGAELRAIVDREGLRIGVDAALVNLYRLGVAHERARHAPAQDRATDEELMALASNAHRERIGESVSLGDLRDLVRRVAARVRQERCLVAQAARGLAFVRECQRQQDRATDEELGMVLYGSRSIVRWDELADGTRAEHVERARVVAARVRQERCLVAQAVAANVDIRVCEDDGGGFMLGVHESGCDEELARCVPAADVPATLARLLGEVSRG